MTEPRILSVLERVQRRLTSPDSWCQFAVARNKEGMAVRPLHPEAVRWDIVGATMVECRDDENLQTLVLGYLHVNRPLGRTLIEVNDNLKSHQEVYQWLFRLINKERAAYGGDDNRAVGSPIPA